MEFIFADIINNVKIPKWVRYLIVGVVCGAVVFLGVMLMLHSPMLVGNIFGGILAALFLAAAAYLFLKIAKSRAVGGEPSGKSSE